MNREAFQSAAQAATVAGFASLFLPSIDSTWDAQDDDAFFGVKLDTGTVIYLGVSFGVGLLYTLAAGSPLPLIVAGIMAGIIVVTQRHAFDKDPEDIEDDT